MKTNEELMKHVEQFECEANCGFSSPEDICDCGMRSVRHNLRNLFKSMRLVPEALQPSEDDDGTTCKCGVVIPIGAEVCYNCEMLANSGDVVSVPEGMILVSLDALNCALEVSKYFQVFGMKIGLSYGSHKIICGYFSELQSALSQPSTVKTPCPNNCIDGVIVRFGGGELDMRTSKCPLHHKSMKPSTVSDGKEG
jgi:hypothetical protein